ncbi:TorF family putative porin [Shewanella decolorationis]|uniref:TorF family putative porin n=1 Tax=Shewanella decolorationis TaxID=256839 RepID=UPI00105731F4|nr:TorF family putative porin [Shewanella decolorationis]
MRKSLCSVLALSTGLLLTTNVFAAVSGNIGGTSNYLWRGVTQTKDAVAIQGGLDYSHDSGFYAGTWASNVDFGDDTSYELDLYAGYGGNITEDLSYDFGYLYYAYPDAEGSIDFGELHGAITWKWFELSYSHVINAGDDVAADPLDDKDMSYLAATASFPLTDKLSLSLHYGYSSGDVVESWFGEDNYADYNVTLSADTSIGTVSFMVSDTDLNGEDAKVVLGYSYGFDL